MDLVVAQGSAGPVGQRLFFTDLSAEDFLADVGEVAVFLLRIDGFEELTSIYDVTEFEDFTLWGWQPEA